MPTTPEDNATADKIFDVVRLREEDHDAVRALVDGLDKCVQCTLKTTATHTYQYQCCCDDCAKRIHRDWKPGMMESFLPQPLRYAPVLRILLERMKTWSKP